MAASTIGRGVGTGKPPRQGHDGQGRILVRVGTERAAIGDEEILHVPGLAPLIGDRLFRVGAHDRAADLVDDLSARLDRLGAIGGGGARNPAANRRDELGE